MIGQFYVAKTIEAIASNYNIIISDIEEFKNIIDEYKPKAKSACGSAVTYKASDINSFYKETPEETLEKVKSFNPSEIDGAVKIKLLGFITDDFVNSIAVKMIDDSTAEVTSDAGILQLPIQKISTAEDNDTINTSSLLSIAKTEDAFADATEVPETPAVTTATPTVMSVGDPSIDAITKLTKKTKASNTKSLVSQYGNCKIGIKVNTNNNLTDIYTEPSEEFAQKEFNLDLNTAETLQKYSEMFCKLSTTPEVVTSWFNTVKECLSVQAQVINLTPAIQKLDIKPLSSKLDIKVLKVTVKDGKSSVTKLYIDNKYNTEQYKSQIKDDFIASNIAVKNIKGTEAEIIAKKATKAEEFMSKIYFCNDEISPAFHKLLTLYQKLEADADKFKKSLKSYSTDLLSSEVFTNSINILETEFKDDKKICKDVCIVEELLFKTTGCLISNNCKLDNIQFVDIADKDSIIYLFQLGIGLNNFTGQISAKHFEEIFSNRAYYLQRSRISIENIRQTLQQAYFNMKSYKTDVARVKSIVNAWLSVLSSKPFFDGLINRYEFSKLFLETFKALYTDEVSVKLFTGPLYPISYLFTPNMISYRSKDVETTMNWISELKESVRLTFNNEKVKSYKPEEILNKYLSVFMDIDWTFYAKVANNTRDDIMPLVTVLYDKLNNYKHSSIDVDPKPKKTKKAAE